MAGFWFVGSDKNQRGPVDLYELRKLIQSGVVTRVTLVWTEGLDQWLSADQVEMLRDEFRSTSAPPPFPPTLPKTLLVNSEQRALSSEATTWGLFWRIILLTIGNVLIIPAPWIGVEYWKYIAETTKFPNGLNFKFRGRMSDVWYLMIAQGIVFWIGQLKFGLLMD